MNDRAGAPSEHELAAYADGSLPAARRAVVDEQIAASAELTAAVERQRRSLGATRLLADEPVPESLVSAVQARRRERGRPRGAPRVALAGALTLALAVVAVASLAGGPAAPSVAEAARVTSRAPNAPAPRPAGEDGTRLALAVEGVVFPDFSGSYGWRAVGRRRDEVDGRAVTTVYYAKGERRLAYAIVAGEGLSRPPSAAGSTRDGVLFESLRAVGRPAVTWRRLGHTCVLAGDAGTDELILLASWRGDGTLRA